VEKWLNACDMSDSMTIIQGADHFFSGHLHQLENAVLKTISP
jgi:alpha/beta superfamily hydrolase